MLCSTGSRRALMAPRDCDLFLPVCFMPDMCPHVLTVSVKLSAVATCYCCHCCQLKVVVGVQFPLLICSHR